MLLVNILQYKFNGVPSQRGSILKHVLDLQLLVKVTCNVIDFSFQNSI